MSFLGIRQYQRTHALIQEQENKILGNTLGIRYIDLILYVIPALIPFTFHPTLGISATNVGTSLDERQNSEG
jgi:hypothetical protein